VRPTVTSNVVSKCIEIFSIHFDVVLFTCKGDATLGAGKDMSPPLLRDVPRRGYNPIYVVHLRGTTAGRKSYAIHIRL